MSTIEVVAWEATGGGEDQDQLLVFLQLLPDLLLVLVLFSWQEGLSCHKRHIQGSSSTCWPCYPTRLFIRSWQPMMSTRRRTTKHFSVWQKGWER